MMNIHRQVDGMKLKRDSATRILGIGNPWWIGKEVCTVMGIKNHRDAISRLDHDEKNGVIIADAMGRPQLTTVVNEWGLYHLIEDSRKPEAERFRR